MLLNVVMGKLCSMSLTFVFIKSLSVDLLRSRKIDLKALVKFRPWEIGLFISIFDLGTVLQANIYFHSRIIIKRGLHLSENTETT